VSDPDDLQHRQHTSGGGEGLSARQRSRRARIAAKASWANTADRTAPATRAFLDRFERQVDPDGVLPAEVRARMAQHARVAYMLRLAERSAQARSRRALREGGDNVRGRAEFRRLVERFENECRRQGVQLSRAAAEDFLVDRVKSMATSLRVREDTVVRSYLADIDVAQLAALFKEAHEHGKREVADTSPAVLDLAAVGRLVASLGQAVRCVSLNQHVLTQDETARWEAVGVLDDASNAITLLGSALEGAFAESGTVSILLNDETVVHIRRCLIQTVDNLGRGRWSFDRDRPELDTAVLIRMGDDLALLPPSG
jgi:hypothetical protein